MSKIGIDARMYGKSQSGIGTYVKQITSHIFELDKKNDYYIFLMEPNYSQFQEPHPKIHKIKTDVPWYSYREQTEFLAQINKYKLDLIHFPHFNAPIFYQGKRLHTIHDITPRFFPGHKQKSYWRRLAYNLTIKNSLAKSEKIITVSSWTKKGLSKYYSVKPEKIEVFYLGVEPQFKIIENYDKIKALKDKHKITKPYLFFVSAWRNHKNFEGLIKAFALLKEKHHQDYQLVLAGQEDPYYPNIKQAIKESKHNNDIIVPGFINDRELALLYNGAKLFVIPSFYEGFGLIGLEAMACGTPVAASNSACLPEILGQAALYFNPYNIEEMAATINKILTDQKLEAQLIDQGLKQVKKYSWQNCAQKTWQLYQELIKQ